MVAQLIKQADGSYEYVDVMTTAKSKPLPPINLLSQVSTEAAKSLPVTDEFEAYEGAKKGGDELISAPSITEQTEKITREIPGQVVFDEKTGQFITKKAKAIDLEYKPGKVTPESTEMTALEKVMSMPSMAGTGDAGLEKAYKLMERQQRATEALTRAQTIGSYAQTGLSLFNITSGKDGVLKKLTTPIKFRGSSLTSMPIGTRGTTLGGAGTAGMLGYGVSGLLGGKPRQQKGAGVGSAIGMVAGGPIGAVVGGAIGHVIGGKVVCTMMNESYGFGSFRSAIWLKYAKDNLTKEHEIGYHIIFIPLVNYAKQKGFLNNIIKKILEHIAIHRTIDIRKETRNKIHLLGRIYRKVLEPICYIVGRIKSWQ